MCVCVCVCVCERERKDVNESNKLSFFPFIPFVGKCLNWKVIFRSRFAFIFVFSSTRKNLKVKKPKNYKFDCC